MCSCSPPSSIDIISKSWCTITAQQRRARTGRWIEISAVSLPTENASHGKLSGKQGKKKNEGEPKIRLKTDPSWPNKLYNLCFTESDQLELRWLHNVKRCRILSHHDLERFTDWALSSLITAVLLLLEIKRGLLCFLFVEKVSASVYASRRCGHSIMPLLRSWTLIKVHWTYCISNEADRGGMCNRSSVWHLFREVQHPQADVLH